MAHRSRLGWADPMDEVPPAPPAHTHKLPRVVRLAIVGLAAAVFLALIGVGLLAMYVYQQQQYIQGKGVQRDRENAEINQRITDRICDLLALAPADSPQADYYREQLACPQPGVATDQLPPAIRQQIPASSEPTSPAPTAPTTQAPLGSSAVPNPPRPTPGQVPPRTGPGPTDEPTPGLLGPITGPVCDVTGVCLGG